MCIHWRSKRKIKIINPPFPIHEFEDVKNLNILKENLTFDQSMLSYTLEDYIT